MKFTLLNQILSDYRTHNRDWHSPGFQALAVQRLGHWAHTEPNPFVRIPTRRVYKRLARMMRRWHGIELHEHTRIGEKLRIDHQNGIVIHGNAVIGDNCVIRQGVTIGSKCVPVADQRHIAPRIGNNVDIGCGAVIIGGITVGDNAVIGANAVVNKDVPAGATMVGIPARSLEELQHYTSWRRALDHRTIKMDANNRLRAVSKGVTNGK